MRGKSRGEHDLYLIRHNRLKIITFFERRMVYRTVDNLFIAMLYNAQIIITLFMLTMEHGDDMNECAIDHFCLPIHLGVKGCGKLQFTTQQKPKEFSINGKGTSSFD